MRGTCSDRKSHNFKKPSETMPQRASCPAVPVCLPTKYMASVKQGHDVNRRSAGRAEARLDASGMVGIISIENCKKRSCIDENHGRAALPAANPSANFRPQSLERDSPDPATMPTY